MYLAQSHLPCMISKSFEKYVNSLRQKRYREERNRFVAEGEKVTEEFLSEKCVVEKLLCTAKWLNRNSGHLNRHAEHIVEVSESEMQRLSSLVTPSTVMLIAEIPQSEIDDRNIETNVHLVLDDIQDPGNLGTIIRIADWFGIEALFCSVNCADAYSPKVVQSSMGSLARIKVKHTGLAELFLQYPSMPVIGMFTRGENLFTVERIKCGFIIIGNEARGISADLEKFIGKKISIPGTGKAESLNAAVAAGITCAWLKRPG
ncbi:MAG: RNA methyltransferase [Chitinophagales bacterium]